MLTELLAPAGSYEILIVAINAGANAVYLAGQRYGARAFAHNFTSEEIEKAVEYAHLNGAQVHVTINTLFNSEEVLEVLKYTQFLYRIGVDAVIVQDLGLIYLLEKFLPELNVHSSTQMTLRDYNSILWAGKHNIKRIILPREMNTGEIKKIHEKLEKDNINLDLEVFGHGSLCYCISGDCYMSSYIHGRSANRGACSQPCRNQYKLKYKNKSISNGCLISTHDLATYKNLKEISDSGVKSIKIEGRLKSEDYVATVVNAYHQLMENINDNISPETLKTIERDLDLTFNRYYTNGYILNDSPGDVMGRKSSYHQGLYLGKITSVKCEEVKIKFHSKDHPTLINGDGIGFKHNNKIRGIYLDNIVKQDEDEITIMTTREVYPGNEVYISYSKALHDNVKKYKKETIKSHIPLSLDISINNKDKVTINASFQVDNTNISFGYKSKEKVEKAINRPTLSTDIEKQFKKTGNTPFFIKNIRLDWRDDIFIPIGQINRIRRELLNKGKNLLLDYFIPDMDESEVKRNNIKQFIKTKDTRKRKLSDSYLGINVMLNSIEQLEAVSKYPLNKVYYDLSFNYNSKDEFFNNLKNDLVEASNILFDKELVLMLPTFISDKDLEYFNGIISSLNRDGFSISVMSDAPSVPSLFDTNVYGAHNLNLWNNFTSKVLADSGFKSLTISNEISSGEIKSLSEFNVDSVDLELIIFGNQEIMTTNDNFTKLVGNRDLELSSYDYALLEDKKHGYKFKVLKDYNDRSHFFNTECLCLIDELDELKSLGLTSVTLDCRFTSVNYLNKVVSMHFQKLDDLDSNLSYFDEISGFSNSLLNKGNFLSGRRLESKR